jgi:uncharacterized protein (DUF1810 family)
MQRFIDAQEHSHEQALAELRAGRKQSHWIWYILPQLRGLGRSPMAHRYGLEDREEAAAYVRHPVLGPRLVECVQTILKHRDRSAAEILGETDAMKLRSCLTLFAEVAPDEPSFQEALAIFFDGQPDLETLRMLRAAR